MKIASWNVNGIRACITKGFWDWFDRENADIVCLQETKITQIDFDAVITAHIKSRNLFHVVAPAQKAGYSGVAILSKQQPQKVEIGLGIKEFDDEGRTIFAHYDQFVLVNTYFPNGQRNLGRIPYKISYSDALLKKLQKIRKTEPKVIICGDMNVAHAEIDIKNPKSNANNSGFTQVERDWFSKFLAHGYVDTFRQINPEARDVYTWWSYRPGVREKNIGWRIDYFVVSRESLPHVTSASVQMAQCGSDHCPIGLEWAPDQSS